MLVVCVTGLRFFLLTTKCTAGLCIPTSSASRVPPLPSVRWGPVQLLMWHLMNPASPHPHTARSCSNLKGACEMAQWGKKALAAKPDSLSSIPETDMVGRENQPSHAVLTYVHMCGW